MLTIKTWICKWKFQMHCSNWVHCLLWSVIASSTKCLHKVQPTQGWALILTNQIPFAACSQTSLWPTGASNALCMWATDCQGILVEHTKTHLLRLKGLRLLLFTCCQTIMHRPVEGDKAPAILLRSKAFVASMHQWSVSCISAQCSRCWLLWQEKKDAANSVK